MDLKSVFKPIIIITVEELGSKTKLTEDIVKKCLLALEKKYQILLNTENKTIYIAGRK